MKHLTFIVVFLLTSMFSFGQQWTGISSQQPETIKTTLVASSEASVTVRLQVPGFNAIPVNTPRGEAYVITVPKTVSTSDAGEPKLPMIAVPAIIGDRQHYSIRVVDTQYLDYGMEVAPSKGDFPRTINPADVPYTYSEAYSTDDFFPTEKVSLYEPYILRDFRGQNMVVYPFAYNPVSKTLRVYYDMTVELYCDQQQGENTLDRRSSLVKMDPEIKVMYEHQFINFSESMNRYTPMVETGELLIICHDAFMNAMQPFVSWKKQIGRPTTMVGTSTTGTTASAIQSYIQSQYNANSNLTHVLLVGDVAQIPGISYTAGSGWSNYSGKSDNMYGQVVGNDLYNDIIVGRFSAENETQVTTQVNKVIYYERDLNASDTWLTYGDGLGNNDGPGHFNELDWQHVNNIRTDLLNYHYTTVYQDYPGVSGYSSSAAILSQHINQGVSIINYCNHGSETSWALNSYSNSNVNALTNVNKLPIVWSVACLNGKYDHSQPCFGETWMRANNSNSPEQPTGAVGGMFSYISQPWEPPQYGQDEMVDVLVESYSNNIKRTLGGCSFDGNMKVLDQYGQNNNPAKGTYLAWILYGDPTLIMRNAVPADMGVTHAPVLNIGATSFTVNATNGNDALATLSFNGEILGSATITNGTANLSFNAPGQLGEATLTVIGYNKITYTATVNITSGGNDPLAVTATAASSVIARGTSTALNAQATGGNWMFSYSWSPATSLNNPNLQSPMANPTTTTTYTCTVTSGDQTQTDECTVEVVCPPDNVTATLNDHDVELQWDAANPAESYKIYRNNTMIAQNVTGTSYTDANLNAGNYSYQVASVYQNVTSPKSTAASVSIQATLAVTATATPEIIPMGGSTTLRAIVSGGSGSITYQWTPAESLSNPTAMAPTATPTETTLYTVTATCNGVSATAEINVQVVTPPTGVAAELLPDDEYSVLLSWEAATLVDTYTVYCNSEVISDNLTETNRILTLPSSGNYCLSVTAVYGGVESPNSEETCVEIFVCIPAEDFTATYYWDNSTFGTLLAWDKDPEVNMSLNKYYIFRGTSPDKMDEIAHQVNVPYNYHYEYRDETVEIGEYYYMIRADYGEHGACDSEIIPVMVTSVKAHSEAFQVYPNPTQGKAYIEGAQVEKAQVFNTMGQCVMTFLNTNEINLEGLPQGVYTLRITDLQGFQTNQQIVVK